MATYAFSDLHGNYNLWQQIKNYLQDDDFCYCLGDCNDRGNDGIKIIQEVLNCKNIKYICGNHEIMLLDLVSVPSACWDTDDKKIIK